MVLVGFVLVFFLVVVVVVVVVFAAAAFACSFVSALASFPSVPRPLSTDLSVADGDGVGRFAAEVVVVVGGGGGEFRGDEGARGRGLLAVVGSGSTAAVAGETAAAAGIAAVAAVGGGGRW